MYRPPRVADSWVSGRPGELEGALQPSGGLWGYPGPDQGYALRLARRLANRVVLADGEDLDDVIAGCVAVALRRASLLGRAPVIGDLEVAFTIFGYLSEPSEVPGELVALRSRLFEEVSSPHHYAELRLAAESVSEQALLLPPDEVVERRSEDWRALFDSTAAPAAPG